MKTYTQREAFRMLADGKKMRGSNWEDHEFIHFNVDGVVIDQDGNVMPLSDMFIFKWQEYTEPKWYDNIPDGGVLCWAVGARLNNPVVVKSHDKAWEQPFRTASGMHVTTAEPLTPEEIALFASNAPKVGE